MVSHWVIRESSCDIWNCQSRSILKLVVSRVRVQHRLVVLVVLPLYSCIFVPCLLGWNTTEQVLVMVWYQVYGGCSFSHSMSLVKLFVPLSQGLSNAVQSVFPITAYLLAVVRQAKCPLVVITGSIWQGQVYQLLVVGGLHFVRIILSHVQYRESPVKGVPPANIP